MDRMNTRARYDGVRGAGLAGAACLTLLVAGCGGLPERVDSLELAREAVRSAEQDQLASEVAATELAAARTALSEADELFEEDAELELVEHQAYLAQRYADIAEQRIAEAHAREEIAQAEAERNRVLLQARAREAEAAEREAELAQQRAQSAEQQALAAEREAQAAQQRAQTTAEQAAAIARENQELMESLDELQARETERGVVLTLSDVLFDTAEAQLKPGAEMALDRLAAFMRDYPERNVRIEGHTDARGTEEYNRDLSQRRAQAVEDALLARGIPAERLETAGLGEAYPVASNETTAGMQENRRVEIVVSNGGGDFGQAEAERRAAVN